MGQRQPPYRSMMPRIPTTLGQMLGIQPVASHPQEEQFQQWMLDVAQKRGAGMDPDGNSVDPRIYDYRSAMMAGVPIPSSDEHWDSRFKGPDHPSYIVGGFNTKTGERAQGAPLAKSVQELIRLGWEPATAHELWKKR